MLFADGLESKEESPYELADASRPVRTEKKQT